MTQEKRSEIDSIWNRLYFKKSQIAEPHSVLHFCSS